jgi:Ca-activated chloride channel homolog
MPGRDITRLRNRPARVLLCIFLTWAGVESANPAWAQVAPPPSDTKPATPVAAPAPAPATPALATPPSSTPAQTQDKQDEQDRNLNDQGVFVFKKDVDEVMLHASVIDDKQHIITTLDRGAFTVFEDGKPQNIISFHQVDIPVSMGIIIDNSGSMREKRAKVNQAALNLVRSSNPKDEVFVVNFNDEYYLDQDFTSDLTRLREGLDHIESRGGTALYDAVVASADHLAKGARLERKVLLIVTDGEDNASRESLEQCVRRMQDLNGPTVYSIGLLGDDRESHRAKRALTALALQTGGVAFFPKDLNEVDNITRQVAHDIRNQYTIGYKPSDPNRPGYRAVRVEAHSPAYKHLVVRTRSGYYAGQERASR